MNRSGGFRKTIVGDGNEANRPISKHRSRRQDRETNSENLGSSIICPAQCKSLNRIITLTLTEPGLAENVPDQKTTGNQPEITPGRKINKSRMATHSGIVVVGTSRGGVESRRTNPGDSGSSIAEERRNQSKKCRKDGSGRRSGEVGTNPSKYGSRRKGREAKGTA